MTGPGSPPLAWTELERLVAAGDVDTVIVAFTDMQGRLAGKRISGRHFVDDIATRGVECCSYLLAVDVDLNTVPGYAMASWDTGYGDMVMTPDLSTLRLIPWLPGTALVIADLVWADGSEVAVSPRSILRRQLDRLKARGLVADVATELEFIVFDQPYRQAWASGYRGLTPASDYNIDYAILASSRMEPLLRDIRLGMAGAGLRFEAVKGECNMGQQEIGFRYDEALVTCDNHAIYKNGAKEIADQHGKSLTFMAKYDEREGNSCHIHVSLRGTDGSAVFADSNGPHGMSSMFRSFVAGQLATLREFTLCYAPTINSYKRFADSSFARRRRWLGGWTIAPAPCGWLATGKTSGSNAGFPAVMSTSTWRWRLSLLEGCTVSSGAFSCPSPVSATPTKAPMSNGCRLRWPTPRCCSRILRWCARRSARMLSRTT